MNVGISGASTTAELRQFFKDTGGIHLHCGTNGWAVIRGGSTKCGTPACYIIKYVEVTSPQACIKCGNRN